MTLSSLRGRLRDDTGSISLFMAVFVVCSLLMTAMVVDTTGASRAHRRAEAIAAEAARAGGQAIQAPLSIQGDQPAASVGDAAQAAAEYLATAQVPGNITVEDDTLLHVQTTVTYQTRMLGLIGISTLTFDGDATARLVRTLNGDES